jgi:hypothetical protein
VEWTAHKNVLSHEHEGHGYFQEKMIRHRSFENGKLLRLSISILS